MRLTGKQPPPTDELFESYAGRVLGFALRLTGDRSEAEDLVQEVFLAAHKSRLAYRAESTPLTWLFGITVRRWRDRYRRRQPETAEVPIDESVPESETRRDSLEGGVVDALTMSQALTALPPPFRE